MWKIHWIAKDRFCRGKSDGGLGFRDLEAFNLALLARQLWRLMQSTLSLVYRLLKARYFPTTGILDASIGRYASYTWRSLWEARWIVEKGSRWIVGDGYSLNIWESKWLPRLCSFRVITPFNPQTALIRVGDLIDRDLGEWRVDMVDSIFLPIDVDVIKSIPLSTDWPPDRLTWHYSVTGSFTVKSAYYLIQEVKNGNTPASSNRDSL